MHNEKHYSDPHAFNPERFLDKDGNLDVKVLDPADFIFGFGRRYEDVDLTSVWHRC